MATEETIGGGSSPPVDADPVPRSLIRWRRPLGRLFHLALLPPALGLLWAQTVPVWSQTYDFALLLWSGSVALLFLGAVVWGVRLVGYAFAKYRGRAEGRARWFLVAPAAVVLVVFVGSLVSFDGGPSGDRLEAVSLDDGRRLWSRAVEFGESVYEFGPSRGTAHGLFVFADGDGRLRALKGKSGEEVWASRRIVGKNDSVYVSAEMIVLGGRAGHLVAVDVRTGEVAWRQSAPRLAFDKPKDLYAAGDRVYLWTRSGELLALSPGSGSILWAVSLARAPQIRREWASNGVLEGASRGPIAAGEFVLVQDAFGTVRAFDSATGTLRTTVQAGMYPGGLAGFVGAFGPVVAVIKLQTVVERSESERTDARGTVMLIEAVNDVERWRVAAPAFLGNPAGDERVVAMLPAEHSSDSPYDEDRKRRLEVRATNTGKRLWSATTTACCALTLTRHLVLVENGSAKIEAFRISDGQSRWVTHRSLPWGWTHTATSELFEVGGVVISATSRRAVS